MKQSGYSLIESMVVLALLSTIAFISVLGQQAESERAKVKRGITSLTSLTAYARQLAIVEARTVEIHPTPQGWGIPGSHEIVAPNARWRGFRPPPIRFYSLGDSDNGTWVVCAAPFQAAKGLVLSRSGRTRRTQDSDQDGQHEMASGRAIQC